MIQIPKTTRQLLSNIFRTIRAVWKEQPLLVSSIGLFTLLEAVVPFGVSGSQAFVIDQLISSVGLGTISGRLALAIGLLMTAYVVPSLLNTVQRYLSKLFWFFTDAKFEMDILQKRAEVDIAAYENPKYNDLFTRVQENGVWRLQNFTERQFNTIRDIVQVITATVILGIFQWWLVLLLLGGTLPELLVEIKYGKNVWGMYGANAEVKRRYWSLRRHFDWAEGVMELKLFQNISYFLGSIRKLFVQFQDEQRKIERKKLIAEIAARLLSQACVLAALWWAVVQVVQGNVLVGVFTFLLASISDFRQALSSFFQNMARQYEDSLFVTDIFTLLDLPPLIEQPTAALKLSKNKVPEIVFENVSFKYPNAEQYVLKHVSLRIPAGTRLALVGVNGAGKTTIVKLLCRFYDPTEGRILINGIDLREIDLSTWYGQMGILFQQYNQYHVPVRESILVGDSKKRPTKAGVEAAAEASEADSFIRAWPRGYDQLLGKEFTNGIDPSVGQWQKLALARVFYRNPNAFILDEPTASIDAEAEAHIFERLEKLSKGKTVILISHRFSTVRKADKICIIKDGLLHEEGTHQELIAKNGTYAKLFKLQAKGYE